MTGNNVSVVNEAGARWVYPVDTLERPGYTLFFIDLLIMGERQQLEAVSSFSDQLWKFFGKFFTELLKIAILYNHSINSGVYFWLCNI